MERGPKSRMGAASRSWIRQERDFPLVPSERRQLWHLDLYPSETYFMDFWPQYYETMNLCCSKRLSLWWFVTAAASGKEYRLFPWEKESEGRLDRIPRGVQLEGCACVSHWLGNRWGGDIRTQEHAGARGVGVLLEPLPCLEKLLSSWGGAYDWLWLQPNSEGVKLPTWVWCA